MVLGDPTVYGNMATPRGVTDAVRAALDEPRNHGYPPATGSEVAKAAIAARYSTATAPLQAADVVVASGCSGALEMAIGALCSPGQTILLPQPGFSLYRTLCDNKRIRVLYYRLLPERNWEIDLEQVEALVAGEPSIAAWLINNPSNPCGSVYSRAHLEACKRLAAQHPHLTLLADEIYEDMVFRPNVFYPLASLAPALPMLTCGGLAKRFLVPGWRLGWCLVHDPSPQRHAMAEIRQALTDLAGLILGANSLVQAALPAIFAGVTPAEHQQTNDYLARNAQILYEGLQATPGLRLLRPQGAFYMMLALEMAHFDLTDDVEACERLISEQSIVALPGMVRLG